jgi:hypothetical protein
MAPAKPGPLQFVVQALCLFQYRQRMGRSQVTGGTISALSLL